MAKECEEDDNDGIEQANILGLKRVTTMTNAEKLSWDILTKTVIIELRRSVWHLNFIWLK